VLLFAASAAERAPAAGIPYNNPGPFALPVSGPALPPPSAVKGKQYSDYLDQAFGGGADPAQIISWDGFGGTADDGDLSGPVAPPFSTSGDFQIDALANQRDTLFNEVLADTTHLVYSVDHRSTRIPVGPLASSFTVPSAGPLSFGSAVDVIGGAGEISYELGTLGGSLSSNSHGLWASQAQVNGMPNPVDVDALELWGSEPGAPIDTGKYSVDNDASATIGGVAYSVLNYSDTGHTGYVPHEMVVAFVRDKLGLPTLDASLVELDALMVNDVDQGRGPGTGPDFFNPGDKIIFSIRQLPLASAGDGFLATGSEIFVMDGASTVAVPVGGFLTHGGHVWDKAYALSNMVAHFTPPEGPTFDVQLDLNALEAVSGVPEPGTAVLFVAGLLGLVGGHFRCRAAR
jgi:hypothetical protein